MVNPHLQASWPTQQRFTSIGHLGNRRTDVIDGLTPELLVATNTPARVGVLIHNADSVYELWVYAVAGGSGAPTITSTNRDFVIPPDATLTLDYGHEIDIYGINSSGSASTSAFVSQEVLS